MKIVNNASLDTNYNFYSLQIFSESLQRFAVPILYVDKIHEIGPYYSLKLITVTLFKTKLTFETLSAVTVRITTHRNHRNIVRVNVTLTTFRNVAREASSMSIWIFRYTIHDLFPRKSNNFQLFVPKINEDKNRTNLEKFVAAELMGSQ